MSQLLMACMPCYCRHCEARPEWAMLISSIVSSHRLIWTLLLIPSQYTQYTNSTNTSVSSLTTRITRLLELAASVSQKIIVTSASSPKCSVVTCIHRHRIYNPKHPCSHCGKGVTGRTRAISCDSCDQWTHIKGAGVLSNDAYDELCSSGGEFTHLCGLCALHALPFGDDSDHPDDIMQGNDLRSEIVEDAADQATTERPLDFECLHSKDLNFIHLNTRSLLPTLDELRILAANTKAAVIGITESWLDASVTDSEINITDYSILRRDINREGGGVCIYIRNYFIFKLRDDICTTLETVWAEL